jgi:hypothetical protein
MNKMNENFVEESDHPNFALSQYLPLGTEKCHEKPLLRIAILQAEI